MSPSISATELEEVEREIRLAFDSRSIDHLCVLGFGELGLAVGWPSEAPQVVCKRQAPGSVATVDADEARMRAYHDALEARGVSLVPTEFRRTELDDGRVVPYLIQPALDPETLAENVLAAAEPHADHPVLVAIGHMVLDVVTDTPELGLSIDAQVTNFSWDGRTAHILDTTPPLLWDASTGPFYDVGNYLLALPAPLRPAALRITRRTGDIYRTPEGTLRRTVIFLKRIGQDRWVDAAMTTFNSMLATPLELADVEADYAQAVRDFPLIKRLARMQRFWTRHVLRRRYEFFITNSFTGEIL